MLAEFFANAPNAQVDGPLDLFKLITTGGALGVLVWVLWWLSNGKFRHEREVTASDSIWRERWQNERQEREHDAKDFAERLQYLKAELDHRNQQLDRALHVAGESRPLAQQALNLAEKVLPQPADGSADSRRSST